MRQKKKPQDPATIPWEGRDEMNLAEFPIAVLASRPDKNLKTIRFEDRTWDKSRDCWVPRQLTISASDRYGLPTALDDEVILGLIQLTREADFTDRKVFFSRYRLLKILGWRLEGKSYARLETSLKRWLGVTFYYHNAWWDKKSQSWVDENFHLLEQVLFYHSRQKSLANREEPMLSLFVWNEVVFRSFQAGYLKQIDLSLFRRLKSPISKRLYRHLDKRFYHKPTWEFNLRELACEHIGLSRSYDTGQLKRKLKPAIEELVEVGYLQPLDDQERFRRLGKGVWLVVFAQAAKKNFVDAPKEKNEEAKRLLLARGVHPATADSLAGEYPIKEIRRRISILDWLEKNALKNAPKNPAGYLVQSLRESYDPPAGFGENQIVGARKGNLSPAKPSHRKRISRETRDSAVRQFINALKPEERKQYEKDALQAADPFLASTYRNAVKEQSPLLEEVYLQVILERFVTEKLIVKKGS
ncbi:MAG: replication initiator protein A [Pirellulales bacterium]|nr:replication initiator protein A [Pirellulales bacterium]